MKSADDKILQVICAFYSSLFLVIFSSKCILWATHWNCLVSSVYPNCQSQQLSSALSSACDFKSHFANIVDPDQTVPLIRVHSLALCKNRFEKFVRIFSRRHKQTTFSDAGFLGILRVNLYHSLG